MVAEVVDPPDGARPRGLSGDVVRVPGTDPQDREDLAHVASYSIASYSVDSSGEDRSVSSKLHGTVWPPDEALDNFMITEEGSGEFFSRMTTNVTSAVPAQAV